MRPKETSDQAKKVLSVDDFYEIQKRKCNIVAELHDHPFLMQDNLIKRAYEHLKDWNNKGIKWFETRISNLKIQRQLSASAQ